MAPTISPLFLAEVTNAKDDVSLLQTEPVAVYKQPYQVPQKRQHHKVHQTSSDRHPTSTTTYKWDLVWRNVLGMIYLHVFTFYGVYLMFFGARWVTLFFAIFLAIFSGLGITAGAHRLWAHRCYKAKWPLRLLLAVCQTTAFQNHIYEWVRDHRVHHKFSDTDADPHNATRGFFFSHMGWLLVRKHPDILTKGKSVDLTDLLEDPIVRFQRRFYLILMPLCCFVIPTLVPYYFWNEDLFVSWYVAAVARYTLTLNGTWLVNSAAHLYGLKPYDKSINPRQNKFVAVLAFGEGWHNYHHIFPWDYKASEFGYHINMTTSVIDFFARIGWAYDLKTVSRELIERRVARTGDGSRRYGYNTGFEDNKGKNEESSSSNHHQHQHTHVVKDGMEIWGWGDKDISDEHVKYAEISNKLVE